MKKRFLAALATGLLVVGMGGVAQALPSLQMDIAGGVYDPVTQTVIASDTNFTLYAFLIPDDNALLTDTYYISAAIIPMLDAADAGDYGSFVFNGTVIDVTGDMLYGRPPISTVATTEPSLDLQAHSVFDTYFTEFSFKFDPALDFTPYNTESFTGIVPAVDTDGDGIDEDGDGMYYAAFNVDTSSLSYPYVVHFDFYNVKYDSKKGSIVINQNAPFSHDAQSSPVPEPATMLLFGTGLAGLAGIARRRKKA